MDMVLADVKWSNYLVYIDDIYMVMGNTFQHPLQNLGLVLQKLTYGTGSPEKPGIVTDPAKVNTVKKWPVPTTVQELQRLLGLAGYYTEAQATYAQ